MVMELMGMDMDPAGMGLDMGTLATDVLWEYNGGYGGIMNYGAPLIGGVIRGYDSRFVNMFVLAVLSCIALVQSDGIHQPQPYKFGYSIKDKYGEQHRDESGNGAGAVKTNEPGTANQNPAAVQVISNDPYSKKAAESYGYEGYSSQMSGYGGYNNGYGNQMGSYGGYNNGYGNQMGGYGGYNRGYGNQMGGYGGYNVDMDMVTKWGTK
ncbi:uncharacterized protein CEXT_791411 [Caerostris extrusa]|uniref:Uncharacterized protein n=1 Tax=Caerostris extrusa TaxID=172846 RepID=A0AAV4M4K1_CAEEX|nr:uncharacterized protein CEXT_791411 [Caerostris extrusa]